MEERWLPSETTTHQDHVIAHVIGATALGHFIWDEAVYILLDIGFVWMILLDGEMGLLPHPVAVGELEISEPVKEQIKADIELLLSNRASQSRLGQLSKPSFECRIKEVSFFEQYDRRRLIISGEDASLTVESSLTTAEIQVHEF